MNKKIRRIVYIACLAAILAIISPWSIPIGNIPITLATFGIYLIGALTKKFDGFLVTLIYLIIGIIGIPVFSSFRSGFSVILGPTGGYLIGYLIGVLIISFLTMINKKKIIWYPISMILATIIWYLFGSIWYMIITNSTIYATLMVCVVPFLIFDLIKIIIASIVSYLINNKTIVSTLIY